VDLGLFAQDRWTVRNLTLNLGVRFDYYTIVFPEVTLGPAPLVPTRNITFPRTEWVNWKDVTPRLGLAYNLFGDGKTALKTSLNKYVTAGSIHLGVLGGGSNPVNALANFVTRSWNDANANYWPDCDLTNVLANGECGATSDRNFGSPIRTLDVDPDARQGWGRREYNWEFTAGVQHELLPRLSVDASYFRRWYGNFIVTDNRAVGAADFDAFSITAPRDSRLPEGGGYVIPGLFNLNPSKVGQVDNYVTRASNFGNRIERWNGVDVSAVARLEGGVTLQGGISTGRTLTDSCEIRSALPEEAPTNPYCRVEGAFLTQAKFFGTYTIPRVDVQVAATFQSFPGPEIAANFNAPNAAVQPSLGRPLSGGAANATVNLVQPGSIFGERTNQLDFRVAKALRAGRTRTSVNLDLFNALNSSAVQTLNNNFAVWQVPNSIIMARFARLSVQFDF
jgi:hypothetical protein